MDPFWRCLDSERVFERKELELVIQKPKVDAVMSWFYEHFTKASRLEYIKKCPIVFLQGPPGCGKTATLRCIANELKVGFKEYNDITDTTTLKPYLNSLSLEEERTNLSLNIAKREAHKFELFVHQSVLFKPLGSKSFNSDLANRDDGLIILVETPLLFANVQRVFNQCLCRLVSIVRELAKRVKKRVAIVFEALGINNGVIVPAKLKDQLGIEIFKFNAITKSNMSRLIHSLLKEYPNIILQQPTIELIISDSNGDIRACINSLQVIFNGSAETSDTVDKTNMIEMQRRGYSKTDGFKNCQFKDDDEPVHCEKSKSPCPLKKMKTSHNKTLKMNLLRACHRQADHFYHLLGKIFYQKRLYPGPVSSCSSQPLDRIPSGTVTYQLESSSASNHCVEDVSKQHLINQQLSRPFPTENKSEDLSMMVDSSPEYFMPWLHEHYVKFVEARNIDKAAQFSENFAIVDTISLNSTQTSQFYELHHSCDEIQTLLAINATIFSLYKDKSNQMRKTDKVQAESGQILFKRSSVEREGPQMVSYKKPCLLNLHRLVADYDQILDYVSVKVGNIDKRKLRLDYVPYLASLLTAKDYIPNLDLMSRRASQELDSLSFGENKDFDSRHETLRLIIDEIYTLENSQPKSTSEDMNI